VSDSVILGPSASITKGSGSVRKIKPLPTARQVDVAKAGLPSGNSRWAPPDSARPIERGGGETLRFTGWTADEIPGPAADVAPQQWYAIADSRVRGAGFQAARVTSRQAIVDDRPIATALIRPHLFGLQDSK
jgi:hypothetical protein